MRILYGVAGEGFGHSSRAETIATLLSDEHDILFAGSRNSYSYLKQQGYNIIKTYGYRFSFTNKRRIHSLLTFWRNTQELSREGFKLIISLIKKAKEFNPHIIISDFEPFTAIIAKLLGKRLISLDHQNIITRTKIEFPKRFIQDYNSAKLVIEAMVTNADHYLITSFFYPTIKRKRTTLIPPIIREEVFKQRPRYDDNILVYYSYIKDARIIKVLRSIKKERFIIYGGYKKKRIKGNLIFQPRDKETFIRDLAGAKAVITNGGYTLISEAIHLRKPVLSIPFPGQFEQVLNAYYLDKLGYGKYYDELDSVKLRGFLNSLDLYKSRLRRVSLDGNKRVTYELRRLIQKFC